MNTRLGKAEEVKEPWYQNPIVGAIIGLSLCMFLLLAYDYSRLWYIGYVSDLDNIPSVPVTVSGIYKEIGSAAVVRMPDGRLETVTTPVSYTLVGRRCPTILSFTVCVDVVTDASEQEYLDYQAIQGASAK